jgi:hypothetical protein
LYRNDGDANFTDISYDAKITEMTIPFLGWGTAFLDYDNDGWKDLLEVNGHIYPDADANNWGTTWAQRPLLFHNVGGNSLEPVAAVEGSALATPMSSRGLAVGDLFNDGKLDAVVNNIDGVPALMKNVDGSHNHWLGLRLIGGAKSPRDAIGATIYVTANGMKQRGDVFSGGSYASTSDMRPHFGLGTVTKVERLEVRWPSGNVEVFPVADVDRFLTLTEGHGSPVPVGTESPKNQ